MPDDPASQAGAGGQGDPESEDGGGEPGEPLQTFPSGTQTLTCSPLNVDCIEHVRPLSQLPPLPQSGAQNVSPWNCAQTAPPLQSLSERHVGQSGDPGPVVPGDPPSGFPSARRPLPSFAEAQPADQPTPKPARTVIEPRIVIETRTLHLRGESTSGGEMSWAPGGDHRDVTNSSMIRYVRNDPHSL
jgi:hypothetical protein